MFHCEVALHGVLIHNEKWERTALPEHAGPLTCIPWTAPASTAGSCQHSHHSEAELVVSALPFRA